MQAQNLIFNLIIKKNIFMCHKKYIQHSIQIGLCPLLNEKILILLKYNFDSPLLQITCNPIQLPLAPEKLARYRFFVFRLHSSHPIYVKLILPKAFQLSLLYFKPICTPIAANLLLLLLIHWVMWWCGDVRIFIALISDL